MDDTIPEGVSLLGKELSDLQSGVSVGMNDISGTVHYVTGYTGFSGDPAEQQGNYLALHIDSDEDTTITVELIGGTHGPVTLDSDRTLVVRLRNKQQKIKITVTKDGYDTITRTYTLAGLTLEAPAS